MTCQKRVYDWDNHEQNQAVWAQYESELAEDFGTKPCGKLVFSGEYCPEHGGKQFYCAGFLINRNTQQVAMVRKNRPAWQAGKLNAIGGHLEIGESPDRAMKREFVEETGVDNLDWRQFCILTGKTFVVYFFRAFTDAPMETLVQSVTDEQIEVCSISRLLSKEEHTISNIRWLLTMALDIDEDQANAFCVTEII